MKTLKEKIEVMQAAERGEPIECIGLAGSLGVASYPKWTLACTVSWNWGAFDYRVAPKPIEAWVNVYPGNDNTLHWTKESADDFAIHNRIRCAKLREVTE